MVSAAVAVRARGEKCRCHAVVRPARKRYHSRLHDRCGGGAARGTSAHHSADRLKTQQKCAVRGPLPGRLKSVTDRRTGASESVVTDYYTQALFHRTGCGTV